MLNQHWIEVAMAQANARTENDYRRTVVDGYTIESVERGVHHKDWMAWVSGDRKVWGTGKTREEAVKTAVRTVKSMET